MKSILYFFINDKYFNLYYNNFYLLNSFIKGGKLYNKKEYINILKKSNAITNNNCINIDFIEFIIYLAIHHSLINKYNYDLYYSNKIIKYLKKKTNNINDINFKIIIKEELLNIQKKFSNYNFGNILEKIKKIDLNNFNRKLFFSILFNNIKNTLLDDFEDKHNNIMYNYLLEDQSSNNLKIDTKEQIFLNNYLEITYKSNFYSEVYPIRDNNDIDRLLKVEFKKNSKNIPLFANFIPLFPNDKNKYFFRNLYSYIYVISSNKQFNKNTVFTHFNLDMSYFEIINKLYKKNILKRKKQSGGSLFNLDKFMNIYLRTNNNQLKNFLNNLDKNLVINENIIKKKNKIIYKIFLKKIHNDSLDLNNEKFNIIKHNNTVLSVINILKKI
jgi:hypothetical protein